MSILPLREKTDKKIKTDSIYSFNCKSSSCNKDKIIIFKVNNNISDYISIITTTTTITSTTPTTTTTTAA